MPRLVGHRSHTGANITILMIIIAMFGVIYEYFGVMNIVPGFGREGRFFQLKSQPTNEQVIGKPNQ
ncbi:hypothetical protein H6G76_35615 [Nostoc sp. FACHB-152]|uniref:hypothetical protein n=1 Tax=unclassified Nostoc TaxID=2593658 RepID=UPI00168618C6|nr:MULTISPECIES: hypothetical protein [unclassified Nostoc]MBD2452340.1 hypothetical protein [Nostoc sp. FACHB-152]MBD2472312.1 hypothetical protein [Nostoc sp. FACHB-145]